MSERFTITNNAETQARNQGYDDGLRGKREPPENITQRAAYLSGHRRGDERRQELEREAGRG